jgi:hypothetical protein
MNVEGAIKFIAKFIARDASLAQHPMLHVQKAFWSFRPSGLWR